MLFTIFSAFGRTAELISRAVARVAGMSGWLSRSGAQCREQRHGSRNPGLLVLASWVEALPNWGGRPLAFCVLGYARKPDQERPGQPEVIAGGYRSRQYCRQLSSSRSALGESFKTAARRTHMGRPRRQGGHERPAPHRRAGRVSGSSGRSDWRSRVVACNWSRSRLAWR